MLLLNQFFNSLQFLNNFYLPNFNAFCKKRILYKIKPKVNQITFITGLGMVRIGNRCSFGYKLGGFHHGGSIEFQARYEKSEIMIGNNVATNNNVFLCAAKSILIGDDTLIGQNVTMIDHDAHGINPNKRREVGEFGIIQIGKNVWIGNNVTILKNSEIGDNSIVAAGAVISGKFPNNVIIGGVPGKVIKEIND